MIKLIDSKKGISLIALIITIVVMLILIGVSVNIALQNGLFKSAQNVAQGTEFAKINETKTSSGQVQLEDGTWINIEDYAKGITSLSDAPTHILIFANHTFKIDANTTWLQVFSVYPDEWTLEADYYIYTSTHGYLFKYQEGDSPTPPLINIDYANDKILPYFDTPGTIFCGQTIQDENGIVKLQESIASANFTVSLQEM